MSFAGPVLIAYKHEVDKFYPAVDWDLLAFFAGLFVVINTMDTPRSWRDRVGDRGDDRGGVNLGTGPVLVASAVASSVTDNIPLAAMLAKIPKNNPAEYSANAPYWWSVIFGANLGGNITPSVWRPRWWR
ncbi:MAG: hypothetical protein CM1200mP2_31820 [Planctomycetaceae bacterium]|nr:MAG: hypothetical protein CM1200mP2_31820 [Planctomycetaceae bacterium]